LRVGGAKIAPSLVQRLLNEVGDDPDQLPVLHNQLLDGILPDEIFDALPDRRYQSAREMMVDLKNLRRVLDAEQDHGNPHRVTGQVEGGGDSRSTPTAA